MFACRISCIFVSPLGEIPRCDDIRITAVNNNSSVVVIKFTETCFGSFSSITCASNHKFCTVILTCHLMSAYYNSETEWLRLVICFEARS